MERLYQTVIVSLLCYLVTAGQAGCLFGQNVCSLAVRVLSPDGKRPEVAVSVEEKSGRREEVDQEDSDVQFCDLGGLPVTVKVGDDGTCNQVVIRGVPVSWNQPYLLVVTYDPEACPKDVPSSPVPTCRIVFRVSNTRGEWIKGAMIKIDQPSPTELKADLFGRASFVVALSEESSGWAENRGGRTHFKFVCTRREPIHEEFLTVGNP